MRLVGLALFAKFLLQAEQYHGGKCENKAFWNSDLEGEAKSSRGISRKLFCLPKLVLESFFIVDMVKYMCM